MSMHPVAEAFCKDAPAVWLNGYYGSLTYLLLAKMAAIVVADNYKCIFLNQDEMIPIRISLKSVSMSPIDKNPALVKVMAWCRTDDITWTNADPVH